MFELLLIGRMLYVLDRRKFASYTYGGIVVKVEFKIETWLPPIL